jgi:hypothetical protein
MQCARFRWNISWEDDILKFDYDALGEYLFKNYYKMTDKERQAFFDLDVMVELINRDIAKVMPVEEEEEVEMDEMTEMTEMTGMTPFSETSCVPVCVCAGTRKSFEIMNICVICVICVTNRKNKNQPNTITL